MKVKRKEGERAFIVIRQGRIRDETRDSGTETGKGRKTETVGPERARSKTRDKITVPAEAPGAEILPRA
jgi:predicted DNA-binding antitoxin AbrB/MazE fold protein